jgi:hypothetical protein
MAKGVAPHSRLLCSRARPTLARLKDVAPFFLITRFGGFALHEG